jgi:PAS domain S-box-containing protein
MRLKAEMQARRKIDASQHSVSLCDLARPDAPLIYVNKGFEALTGYRKDEVTGKNCRFLQGPDTDPAAVDAIRDAISGNRPLILDLLNYRKDGSPFWNRLSLRPVLRADGTASHIIGIQSDLTKVKAVEEKLLGYALEMAGEVAQPN